MATPGKRLYQRAREKNPGAAKYPLVTRKAGILVAMALELPGSILGGLVIGYLLDQYFKTWVCDKFMGKLLTPPSDFPKTPPIGR